MAVFIRRFLFDPGNTVLLNIESVNVLDLTPPSAISGIGTGTVLLVGEFENGPFNTPVQVASATDFLTQFGSLGFTYGGVPGQFPCAVQRFADGAITGENWNGNGFVQLNGKQFGNLLICRVDTSVGSIQFTPRAFLTGATAFRYVLAPGQVLGLDAGAGPLTATFSATAGTVTSAAATYAVVNGDTVTLGYDGVPNFVVTFLTGDNSQAAVIARINQYAGFAFAATATGQFSLTGLQKGNQAQVRVVASSSGGVLTALGLTVATTFGTGNVANIQAVTIPEIAGVVQAAVANTFVETDQNGALRISNTLGTATSFLSVTSATTATALGFVNGTTVGTNIGTYLGVAAILGIGGVFNTANSGTITLAIDDNLQSKPVNNGQPFTVTITAGQTAAAVITAINTAAGKTIAFADGPQIALIGTAPGGRINIVGASAANVLSQLGFSPGITNGLALPNGTIPAGTVVQNSGATQVFVTMQDIVFSGGNVTIGATATGPISVAAMGPWTVKIRPATDNGTATSAGAGSLTSIPTPPLLFSLTATNPQITSAAITETAIDAAYVTALAATTDVNTVAKTTNIIYSARQSNTIRRGLRSNALFASANGCFGRVACIRTPLGLAKATAMSVTADPGVGAYRDQRVIYCYPQAASFVPIIAQRGTSGGTGFTANGIVDIGADGFLASIMSQLPPEENPGQETPFANAVVGLESSANAQGFSMQDYINFKAAGVCALRMDNGVALFQSGVTSVDPGIYPSLAPIARRRMADFIQDSLSQRLVAFGKKLSTVLRRKAIEGEIRSFLDQLLNKGNPNGQRIAAYAVDANSANTAATLGQGLYRIIISVQTLASLDSIVLQTTIGNTVDVTQINPSQLAA